jgi:hypothetical protein
VLCGSTWGSFEEISLKLPCVLRKFVRKFQYGDEEVSYVKIASHAGLKKFIFKTTSFHGPNYIKTTSKLPQTG